jgi:nucleoside-diphosphate-sugar epimerase
MAERASFHNAPRDAGYHASRMIDDLQHQLHAAQAEANRAGALAEARPRIGVRDALAVARLLDAAQGVLVGEWGPGHDETVRGIAEAVARITGETPEAALPSVRGILRERWAEEHWRG